MEQKSNLKSISALGAFALSIGTAIGWGSFVVTGSSFVSKAGPLGSIIGLLIGMLIMGVVAYNYSYMMKKYPDSNGGIYSFAKHTLGGDHAFLIAWFLIITYAAILWANISSFSLFYFLLSGKASDVPLLTNQICRFIISIVVRGRGGIGIRARLRGVSGNGYGFKSRRPHFQVLTFCQNLFL